MSKGFCFVAQNNNTTDYVKQACMLALSIHQHNKKQSVSVITNDKIPAKYKLLFDKVIPILPKISLIYSACFNIELNIAIGMLKKAIAIFSVK